MKIFGFGHESRKGKDTAAGLLANHIRANTKRSNVIKTGFSSKLKAICHDLYGWAGLQDEQFYEDPQNEYLRDIKLSKINKTPVEIWIEFGTNVGRAVYPETWIEYPFYRYKDCDYLLIKDVRFLNEVQAILSRGGHVFKVTNSRILPRNTVADRALDGWHGWNGYLINESGIKEFNNNIIEMCEKLI